MFCPINLHKAPADNFITTILIIKYYLLLFPCNERIVSFMGIEHVNGKNKGKVMLYALSTCGWCKRTKELLREIGVEFDYAYVDLLEGKEQDIAMDNVERFNPSGSFPTLVIDDKKCIVGFKEQEIREVFR
jgi:glutaredoxin-like protein NrdH